MRNEVKAILRRLNEVRESLSMRLPSLELIGQDNNVEDLIFEIDQMDEAIQALEEIE